MHAFASPNAIETWTRQHDRGDVGHGNTVRITWINWYLHMVVLSFIFLLSLSQPALNICECDSGNPIKIAFQFLLWRWRIVRWLRPRFFFSIKYSIDSRNQTLLPLNIQIQQDKALNSVFAFRQLSAGGLWFTFASGATVAKRLSLVSVLLLLIFSHTIWAAFVAVSAL